MIGHFGSSKPHRQPLENIKQRLLRIISGPYVLVLADQAVVSGASFLTTVMVSRWTSPAQLGLYSIGMSLLISVLAIQESLISLPYTIQRYRPLGTAAEYAGTSLAQSSLFSALLVVVLAVAALGLSARGAGPGLAAMIWVLVGVMPFALLREFGRRFTFAHLHMAQALILDVAAAAIQLAALGWLGWTGRMSAAGACVAVGGACALSAIVWLYLARTHFAMIRADRVLATMKQAWGLGKWLFASQITLSVQTYVTSWLLAWGLGMSNAGIYAACMSVVLFANPLILGLSNILVPKAVLTLKEGGRARLWREAIRDSLLLGATMILFCAVVLVAGEDVMRLLYHGKEYEGHGHTIMVLALAMLASTIGMPASNAMVSVERPRAVFWVGLFALVVTIGLVPFLVVDWGLVGAAYGFLAGNVAGSVGRWLAFFAAVRCESGADWKQIRMSARAKSISETAVMRVLRQFTRSAHDTGLEIGQLGEGVQAIVYAVRSQNGQPIWQTYSSLAIKVYKSAVAPNVELVCRQSDLLSRLYAALNDSTINGWKILVPRPLYVCQAPLALVMTIVPGQKLSNVVPEVVESASSAIAAAMERYWLLGLLYEDFCFDNILCDGVTRVLSFIDLGAPDNSFFCDDVTKRWYPASHDLAYMLYDTGVSVKSSLGDPGTGLRKQLFTEGAVRAFIETIGPLDEKRLLLEEIQVCARAHVKRLDLSWSLQGLWRVILKPIAARRIDAMLGRLRAELDQFGKVEI